MGHLSAIHGEHQNRLETKLKRELGGQVLALLSDDRTEDILLNPKGALWVNPPPKAPSGLATSRHQWLPVPCAQSPHTSLVEVMQPKCRLRWRPTTTG